jgi:predicted aminopeptidase
LLALSILAPGCGTVRYLIQAGKGQLSLINRARPIDEVVRDERTPARIRSLLKRIPEIKSYGETEGLKPTSNYTEYVKLERPAAVWVVSACEPLRFKSREWGFPVVGSFPYLGWFDLNEAKAFAEELRKEDGAPDVDLRGASAYSTLGWFRDAVLSTMIPEGDEALGDLVNVVIHESVHATYYIKGQAYFNESIASFVADKLTVTFLANRQGVDSAELKAYTKAEQDGEVRRKRLHEAYEQLAALYASSRTDAEKLAEKSRILMQVREELKYKREINNATLIQFKTYNTGDREFEALYEACGKSWPRFWKAMREVRSESFSKGQQEDLKSILTPLATRGCL